MISEFATKVCILLISAVEKGFVGIPELGYMRLSKLLVYGLKIGLVEVSPKCSGSASACGRSQQL